jgi:hypothetical protein
LLASERKNTEEMIRGFGELSISNDWITVICEDVAEENMDCGVR